jgi:outer membrane protein assembly factor BamE
MPSITFQNQLIRAACCAFALLLLSGCGSVSSFSFPGVYRIDIPQGNIITQEMVDQLRPGLTKNQVIFILGTPLVRDTFHQGRWDYVYSFQPGGGERAQERLTLFFENDQLTHFTGDFQQTPENNQFSAAPNTAPSDAAGTAAQ